jgi:hypothetical protein
MALPQTAHSIEPLSRSVDAIRESVARLGAYLPEEEPSEVLLDFLEDDLREGLTAAGEVETYFTDLLELLASERPSAIRLLEAADDLRTLSRLEYLVVVVSQLRRRLGQVAGRLGRSAEAP